MSAVRYVPRILRDDGMIAFDEVAHYTHLNLVKYVEAAAYQAVCEQLRLANIDQANTEAKLNDAKRDLATVQEIGRLREALSLCVDRLIGLSEDGLTKIEQVALSTAQAALAQPAAPSEVKE